MQTYGSWKPPTAWLGDPSRDLTINASGGFRAHAVCSLRTKPLSDARRRAAFDVSVRTRPDGAALDRLNRSYTRGPHSVRCLGPSDAHVETVLTIGSMSHLVPPSLRPHRTSTAGNIVGLRASSVGGIITPSTDILVNMRSFSPWSLGRPSNKCLRDTGS